MSDQSPRTILIATDFDYVFEEVDGALADSTTRVLRVRQGQHVIPAIKEVEPDIVLLDLQIGNMGGVATSLEIRNEESDYRIPPQSVLLLFDRRADVFLYHQTTADGYLIKPLDSLRIRRAVDTILDGEEFLDHTPLLDAQIGRPYDEAADAATPESADGDDSVDGEGTASEDVA